MESNQIVVFKLGKEEYGIDIMRVLEIIDYREVTPIPELPEYIEGMVNIRSDIYPIVNLRKRFRLKGQVIDAESKIVLMNLEELKVGFVVDSVCEILSISEESIQKTPKLIAKYESKYITGVTKQNDRMILLLDVDLLISEDDQEVLVDAMA